MYLTGHDHRRGKLLQRSLTGRFSATSTIGLCRYAEVDGNRLILIVAGVSSCLSRYSLDDWEAIRHVVFEPLDFMAKLASLVPRPRTNSSEIEEVSHTRMKMNLIRAKVKQRYGRGIGFPVLMHT